MTTDKMRFLNLVEKINWNFMNDNVIALYNKATIFINKLHVTFNAAFAQTCVFNLMKK